MEDTEKPRKKSYDWLKQYQFQKGNNANPNGRPKGKSLKEFAREFLMALPDEEKTNYLACLPEDIVWKMAEGNPDIGVQHSGEVEFKIKIDDGSELVEAPLESKIDPPGQASV